MSAQPATTGGSTFLRLLHYNDVYNIQAAEGATSGKQIVGGAARWLRLVRQYQHPDAETAQKYGEPAVLFSGDIVGPSVLSALHLGEHIIPVAMLAKTRASCIANHDLDLGYQTFVNVTRMSDTTTGFPWLCSNAWLVGSGRKEVFGGPLVKRTHVIDVVAGGGVTLKVGLVGLIEEEWLHVMYTLRREDIDWIDPVEAAKELAAELRREQRVDLVVALTHMRVPNDERLAAGTVGVLDLILGGHDHFRYVSAMQPRTPAGAPVVVKSGCDFKDLGVVDVEIDLELLAANRAAQQQQQQGAVKPVVRSVGVKFEAVTADMPEDPECVAKIAPFLSLFSNPRVIGYCAVDLDCTTSSVRTKETAIANWTCAALLHRFSPQVADVALCNAGTIRLDRVLNKGPITTADFAAMFPVLDHLCVISVTGAQLLGALNNGVSELPKEEGRFPCVAGVRFAFSMGAPDRSRRVLPESVVVQDRTTGEWLPLDLDKVYGLVTKTFIWEGRDGYTALQGAPARVDNCLLEGQFNACMRNVLLEMEACAAFRQAAGHGLDSTAVKHAALRLKRLGMLARDPSSSSSSDDDGAKNDEKKDCAEPSAAAATLAASIASKSQEWAAKKRVRQGADVTATALTAEEQQNMRDMMIRLMPHGAVLEPRVDGRIKQLP